MADKQLNIKLSDDQYKKIKLHCAYNNTTIRSLVIAMIDDL